MRKQEVTSFHEIFKNLLKYFLVDEKCVDNADLVKHSCQDKIIQQQSNKIKDNREKIALRPRIVFQHHFAQILSVIIKLH